MTGIISSGPKDFPRIAKEMGFSFSLRRGRVDWQKIGMCTEGVNVLCSI